jgi:citrate synthase
LTINPGDKFFEGVHMPNDLLGSAEAAEFLGVTRATLYSYVSRGMVASVSAGPGERKRFYRRADLLSLKHRSNFRKDPDVAAAGVIDFGTPILTTAISQITAEDHLYRGRSSRELSAKYSFEQVAQFLWTGEVEGDDLRPPLPDWREPLEPLPMPQRSSALTPVESLQALLPVLAHQDPQAFASKAVALVPSAIRTLLWLTKLCTGSEYRASIANTLAEAWSADAKRLDALLIVVADHELNIATFTARCIASAGSNLYQAMTGGLAALQGYKHLQGQVTEARRFFGEVLETSDPAMVVRDYLQHRGSVPGFHNPYRRLYVGKDPRVATISAVLEGLPDHDLLMETMRIAETVTGEHPRIDFVLAASEPLLGLPAKAIFSVIALGRTAGMLAHVMEQYASDRIIRPRARYVGEGG